MISVIIPTYNEADLIAKTINMVRQNDAAGLVKEIIITDGGSTDYTCSIAKNNNATVVHSNKGRALQMNAGAAFATQPVLYFLHADSIPPINYSSFICKSVLQDRPAGFFKMNFDYPHWFLKANCWFTRFNWTIFRFGDQSMYITKKLFLSVGCFDETLILLEDQDFVKRIKKLTNTCILDNTVISSARKYREFGVFRTQATFYFVYFLYRTGVSQKTLLTVYTRLIKSHKF